ncbi:MAG: hypothetical protein RLZZ450_2321 [Pseudomonadota bacterium]
MARLRSTLALDDGLPHAGEAEYARTRSRDIVEGLIRRAQRRTELGFGVVRVLFCLAILARFFRTNDLDSWRSIARAWLEIPAMLGAAAASAPLMVRASRSSLPRWALDASALVDVLATTSTLLAGVLYPWPTYVGLLRLPDLAVLPAVCLMSGLRLSVRTSLLASAVNALLFAALVYLDLTQNRAIAEYGASEIDLYVLYLAGAAALSVVLATRGRSLAENAARHALRAEAARDGLTHVLQDRHDVSSLLSSARINTDLLARPSGLYPAEGGRALLGALQGNLLELSRIIDESRDRTYTELAASAQSESVDPAAIAHSLLAPLRSRYPNVRFELHDERVRQKPLCVAGGARGLERVLINLLVNATEGNGENGATEVLTLLSARGASAELSVLDNGPGFSASLLALRCERFSSTKRRGSGLGLALVESIVVASGGQLRLENTTKGARVTISLPTRGA